MTRKPTYPPPPIVIPVSTAAPDPGPDLLLWVKDLENGLQFAVTPLTSLVTALTRAVGLAPPFLTTTSHGSRVSSVRASYPCQD